MWPEPVQLQCSELFTHTEFTVRNWVSEKACQTQVLKENIPNDQENKEVFPERKGHLLRFGKTLGSLRLRHACCHAGLSVQVKDEHRAQDLVHLVDEGSRVCGSGSASK